MRAKARDPDQPEGVVLAELLNFLAYIRDQKPELWDKVKARAQERHRLIIELIFEQGVSVEAVGQALKKTSDRDRGWTKQILDALRTIRALLELLMGIESEIKHWD